MTMTINISANPSQPCTFASRTSQRTDQSLQKSMSAATHTKNDRQTSGRKEARLPNIGFAKWRVQCFYDSLVQGSSSVLRLKFSGENRHLRKAAKRYRQVKTK